MSWCSLLGIPFFTNHIHFWTYSISTGKVVEVFINIVIIYYALISVLTMIKCHVYTLIIFPKDALQRFGAIFWIDSSFRAIHDVTQWEDVFHVALQNGGLSMGRIVVAPFTNFAWTDPKLYNYIPTDQERQKQTFLSESNAVLIYNTKSVFEKVLWWMYLCSLQFDCCPQSTPSSVAANVNDDEQQDRHHGHRYDQSALNIILSNLHGYNESEYSPKSSHLLVIRVPSTMYSAKICPRS